MVCCGRCIFVAVGFFLVYQAVTREQPDLTVILAVSDTSKAPGLSQKVNDIELALENTVPTLTATDMFTLRFTA